MMKITLRWNFQDGQSQKQIPVFNRGTSRWVKDKGSDERSCKVMQAAPRLSLDIHFKLGFISSWMPMTRVFHCILWVEPTTPTQLYLHLASVWASSNSLWIDLLRNSEINRKIPGVPITVFRISGFMDGTKWHLDLFLVSLGVKGQHGWSR